MGHVDTHLMRAAGLQPALDQCRTIKPLQRAIMGDRMFAATLALHRHLLAVAIRSADPCVDGPRRRRGNAGDDRPIETINAVILELPGQALMGPVGLRDHKEPGRVLVDAMHDPRPSNAPDPGKLPRRNDAAAH